MKPTKSSALILIALSAALSIAPGAPSDAAEVASPVGPSAPITRTAGVLRADDADRLLAGEVPTFARWDKQYGGRRRRGDVCQSVWSQVRARDVVEVPVAANLATIRINAQRAGINPENLNRTLKAFLVNQKSIPNQKFISIVDYTKRSDQKRLFTIDLRTGRVDGFATAAGDGSDRNSDGYAERFSNRHGSHASSLGCFIAAGEYKGKFRRPSLMLHGLEASNDQACARAIVMHPAKYVGDIPGRSNGCLALRKQDVRPVYDRIGGGGLICSYHNGRQARR